MWYDTHGIEKDKFSEQMYVVLVDKTEGETLTRVRAVMQGQGVKEYMNLHRWLTGTTGMAISQRVKHLVHPNTPNKESEITDALDKRVEAKRNLAAITKDYELGESLQLVALECIMHVGRKTILIFQNKHLH